MDNMLHCFRCGEQASLGDSFPAEAERCGSRDCPSCLEHRTLFTCLEMGDLLNRLYMEGTDIGDFGNEAYDDLPL